MKRWQIVYGLPLEVWVDIFCFPWISRKEFGQLVHKIGNFKFAEHAQFYLHEWGRRELTGVCFDKQFNAAKTPSTFAVHWKLHSWQERGVAELHLENGIGEALHGEWAENKNAFQITRHQANCNTQEVRKWIEAMTKARSNRKIWIFNSTIGPLNAPQMAVPPVDEKKQNDQQQKPCSSKDA